MGEFEEFVASVPPRVGPFRPTAYHFPDGNCIEVCWSNESCYAKRLTPTLTLFVGEHTQDVVGVIIEDVAGLLKHDGPRPTQAG